MPESKDAAPISKRHVVTGGSGFVGQRLVEMLIERGAEKVVSFDVAPKPAFALEDPKVEYVQGDITKVEDLISAFKGAECIFHIAALVGPFHAREKYELINYHGTLNVIKACRQLGIKKIVCAGTPSTRMDGSSIRNQKEVDLPIPKKGKFTALYAETKHHAELAIAEAAAQDLLAVTVAPHQVYGPRDALFLPNILNAARSGKLRIFGTGENKISVCYVDNYCHGLILGERKLYKDSPVLGKFYLITDDVAPKLWDFLDEAVVAMGYTSLWSKFKLPYALMITIGCIVNGIAKLLALVGLAQEHRVLDTLKVNWFTVTMMTIDRWFDISEAKTVLGYQPLLQHEEAFAKTLEWFVQYWKPNHRTTVQIKAIGW